MNRTIALLSLAIALGAGFIQGCDREEPAEITEAEVEESNPKATVPRPLSAMELAAILDVRVWEYRVPKDIEGILTLTWEEPGVPPVPLLRTATQSWTEGEPVRFSLRPIGDGHQKITMSNRGTTSTDVELDLGAHVHVKNIRNGIGLGEPDGVLLRTRDDLWNAGEPEKDSVLRVSITPRE